LHNIRCTWSSTSRTLLSQVWILLRTRMCVPIMLLHIRGNHWYNIFANFCTMKINSPEHLHSGNQLHFGFINIVFQVKYNSSLICLLHTIFVKVFGIGFVSSCNLIYTHSIDHTNCYFFYWNKFTGKGNKILHPYIAYHFSDKCFDLRGHG
jgi:hypothetical protein